MKRVSKGASPSSLNEYATNHPNTTWEEMANDNTCGGSLVAHDCRNKAIDDQYGLCAYCEQRISSVTPMRRRLEHFHPKSDVEELRNWGLDWSNMLATCDGGSWKVSDDEKSYSLPENLSCDEHKNRMVGTGKLPITCEGYIINPLDVPAFPNLFSLEGGTWCLKPDIETCEEVTILCNSYETTAELINQTISILNLNCDRLTKKREQLVYNINRNIKTLRDKGYAPSDVPVKLVDRYFKDKWPEFFTTLRCFIGAAVDEYLETNGYCG